jgi:hypothetical protein
MQTGAGITNCFIIYERMRNPFAVDEFNVNHTPIPNYFGRRYGWMLPVGHTNVSQLKAMLSGLMAL